MKSNNKLQLPDSLRNLPMAIAISGIVGYCILDFENIFCSVDVNDAGSNYTLKSFFTNASLINYVPLLLLYLIQFSLYTITSVILFKKIISARVNIPTILTGIATIGILVIIFIKFTVTTNADRTILINHFQPKILLLVGLGIFVSACIGILLYMQLVELDSGLKGIQIFKEDKTHYFKVRKDINSLIFLFGVIISLATLGTAAIQKIAGDAAIAKQAVYYYGVLGSVLMCIIYLPLYLKHKALGYFLIEEFSTEKGIQKNSLESIEFYKKMEDELNLNVSLKDNIMDAIPILAPSAAAALNFF